MKATNSRIPAALICTIAAAATALAGDPSCPQSKKDGAQCCSPSEKSCNLTIQVPGVNGGAAHNEVCVQVTCDSTRKAKHCTGTNTKKTCTQNTDSVTQSFRQYDPIKKDGKCVDCSATVTVVNVSQPVCPTTTMGTDDVPECETQGG